MFFMGEIIKLPAIFVNTEISNIIMMQNIFSLSGE